MLNTFPGLLTYAFFAPTLLRITVALTIGYLAYKHYEKRGEIAAARFPVVGAATWVPWLAIAVELCTMVGLFLGYHTQIFAIIGMLIALKQAVWSSKYPDFILLSRGTAVLLLIILVSIMVTGAGALAFDLPL
ncbi:MAG TPA: hypothetical protein VG934_02090 [Candidatus Paceibacterota bacterium]|nr:hypothetical protein [Candidatus Paceibacterota bacterium]